VVGWMAVSSVCLLDLVDEWTDRPSFGWLSCSGQACRCRDGPWRWVRQEKGAFALAGLQQLELLTGLQNSGWEEDGLLLGKKAY